MTCTLVLLLQIEPMCNTICNCNFQVDITSRARVVVVEVVATVEDRGMTTLHKETEETRTHPEALKTGNFLILKPYVCASKQTFK